MGKPKAPPPPDYTPIAEASKQAAEVSAKVAREQLDWAREQYFLDREVSDLVIEAALDRLDSSDAEARADRERYERIFQPLEDSLAADAASYASPERQEWEAGMAQADVSQQFEQARQNAQQRLEGMGVDPSQVRAGALDISTRTQEAAARASAGNTARRETERMGKALRSEAINVGRGYPGQIAQAYNTATQSGNQAVNSGLATTATGANAMGSPVQWQGNSNQAISGWWSGVNQMYGNQIAAFDAQNRAAAGSMQLPGMILGAGLRLATGGIFGADGGTVPDPQALPPPGAGVAVDPSLSPSNGAVTDDVPARLNAGEFIVPEQAVRWFGEQHFHKLIEKAQKDSQEIPARTGAIPEIGMLQPERPAVNTAVPRG